MGDRPQQRVRAEHSRDPPPPDLTRLRCAAKSSKGSDDQLLRGHRDLTQFVLAGAAEPNVIATGNARIGRESLQEDIRTRGDRALADVPGLLERLDIQHIRKLWPGRVTVQR